MTISDFTEFFRVLAIDSYPPMAETAAMKTVTVMVSNREGTGLTEATAKHNVLVLLFYGNQWFGPVSVAGAIDPGRHATRKWSVPDVPASAVRFYWEEKAGIQNVHREAWFDRDSQSVGKPWDALYLGFVTDNLNNKPYEVARGGIAVMSS